MNVMLGRQGEGGRTLLKVFVREGGNIGIRTDAILLSICMHTPVSSFLMMCMYDKR